MTNPGKFFVDPSGTLKRPNHAKRHPLLENYVLVRFSRVVEGLHPGRFSHELNRIKDFSAP